MNFYLIEAIGGYESINLFCLPFTITRQATDYYKSDAYLDSENFGMETCRFTLQTMLNAQYFPAYR